MRAARSLRPTPAGADPPAAPRSQRALRDALELLSSMRFAISLLT
jgi:hypothetical protein